MADHIENTVWAEPAIKSKRTSALHCCVPQCCNDGRSSASLTFHRFPKDPQLRSKWIWKIRRDVGENFMVNIHNIFYLYYSQCLFLTSIFKITDGTRVCSAHFSKEDFAPPDRAGRRWLKKQSVPSIFKWSSPVDPRRKIFRGRPR